MSRPEIAEQLEQQLLGLRMVDEPGLEGADDLDELLDRQAVLGVLGIERGERLLDQLAGQLGERPGARARRIDEDVPGVEPAAPLLVAQVRIEVDGAHGYTLAEGCRVSERKSLRPRAVYGGGGRGVNQSGARFRTTIR